MHKYTILFVLELDRVYTFSQPLREKPNDIWQYLPAEFTRDDVVEWFIFGGEIIAHGEGGE